MKKLDISNLEESASGDVVIINGKASGLILEIDKNGLLMATRGVDDEISIVRVSLNEYKAPKMLMVQHIDNYHKNHVDYESLNREMEEALL